jgi:pimeloyl-ACP methyl ester carboxylesterase
MPGTRREDVEGIPVILAEPEEVRGGLVLWISHLGGSAEKETPMLERLAAAGHPALSFDPPGHGSRAEGDPREFAQDVLGSFRRRMWPLLGRTTLEALRVLDWACERVDASAGGAAGGVSMGGDVAVALAGIEPRIRRVAAIGSTPDWSRPGMHGLGADAPLIDQGEADRYAQWFADALDPIRHLERYLPGTPIAFELGEADHHIPSANAEEFVSALAAIRPAAASRIRIQTYAGLDHLGVTTDEAALAAAFGWLTENTG